MTDKPTPSTKAAAEETNSLDQMISKAAEVKTRVSRVQEEMRAVSASGSVADGKVSVTCDGDGRMTDIQIDPSLMGGDASVLRELILSATETARKDARAESGQKLVEAVRDLPLPAALTTLLTQLLSLR